MCCPEVQPVSKSGSPLGFIAMVLAGVLMAVLLHAVVYLIVALVLLVLCIFGALGLMVYHDNRPRPPVMYVPRSFADSSPLVAPTQPVLPPTPTAQTLIQQLNVYNNHVYPGGERDTIPVELHRTSLRGPDS